jgi:hypothetical protein
MSEPVSLTALLIAGTTLVLVAGAIALDQRLDFAERLLAQSRDRAALKAENKG